MTKAATVIGAGIAGPVAALTLVNNGYDVTIHEKSELPYDGSIHMITLTADSDKALSELGIDHSELYRFRVMPRHAEFSSGRDIIKNHDGFPSEPGVIWNDLHDALAKRVNITYGSKVDYVPDTKVVVWADGIGSYGRNYLSDREGEYAGEMLFRGLTPRDNSDMAWMNLSGYMTPDGGPGQWDVVTYPTWDKDNTALRGWTFFVPMSKEPWRNTRTLTNVQMSHLARLVRPIVSDRVFDLITNATEITCAPQEFWPSVDHMTYNRDGSRHFLIGDAVGTVSPKTGLGANIAIAEASSDNLSRREWDRAAVNSVNDLFAESRRMVIEDSPFGSMHG